MNSQLSFSIDLPQVQEVELIYKPLINPKHLPKITNSMEAWNIARTCYDANTFYLYESVFMLLLNRSNKVIGKIKLAQGDGSGSVVNQRMAFQTALKANALGIVLIHNHPSGNKKPSSSDIAMTKKFAEGAKLLGMQLLDHLIIADLDDYNNNTSLQDEGIL